MIIPQSAAPAMALRLVVAALAALASARLISAYDIDEVATLQTLQNQFDGYQKEFQELATENLVRKEENSKH